MIGVLSLAKVPFEGDKSNLIQRESLKRFIGTAFIEGEASGDVLACETELSFWGGVDPLSGEVIDRHHPLSGERLKGKILALPGGRGSCSGSGVILEMIVNGQGPAAIIVSRPDDIITLGALIAGELFDTSIPVICLEHNDFQQLITQKYAVVTNNQIFCDDSPILIETIALISTVLDESQIDIHLTDHDLSLVNGDNGAASQVAMKIIIEMAKLAGAKSLIDVSQVHIDGCIYTGDASLQFAQKLVEMGGKVAVPTSLNSISVDYRHWQKQGVSTHFGEQASALADAYITMGAKNTFTCAPYLLETAPNENEQIAWAESNAVVFANSVLGARTMKYPDFLDACIALTGRAPNAGAHLDQNRKATFYFSFEGINEIEDLFYPLLGYHVGKISGNCIPVIDGIAHLVPDQDDLKAFGAAFATVSSAPMFHILGVTPEAKTLSSCMDMNRSNEKRLVTIKNLQDCWFELHKADTLTTDLVSLGNPHFSLSEFKKLSLLCLGKKKSVSVELLITAGRSVVEKARKAGYLDAIEMFGGKIITDTCWCMINDPVIPLNAKVICTNSAKYAHYGPGMTGRSFKLLSLERCVYEACREKLTESSPNWLDD